MRNLFAEIISNNKILSQWGIFLTNLSTESSIFQITKNAKKNLNKQAVFESNGYFYLLPKDTKLQKPFIAKRIVTSTNQNGLQYGKTNTELTPISDKFLEEIKDKHTLLGIIGLILTIGIIGLFLTFTLYFTIMAFLFLIFCLCLFGMGSGSGSNSNMEGFGKALITGMGIGALGSSL